MALDDRLLEEMSVLEPLEHSVLDVALDGRLMDQNFTFNWNASVLWR